MNPFGGKISGILQKCGRCGYVYDPKKPNKMVLVMPCEDGTVMIGCYACIAMIGEAKTEEERRKIMDEMVVSKP